jgi:hypothetical protein
MKNGVFWVVTPCGSCKVLTRATRRNNPEDTILFKSNFVWRLEHTFYGTLSKIRRTKKKKEKLAVV